MAATNARVSKKEKNRCAACAAGVCETVCYTCGGHRCPPGNCPAYGSVRRAYSGRVGLFGIKPKCDICGHAHATEAHSCTICSENHGAWECPNVPECELCGRAHETEDHECGICGGNHNAKKCPRLVVCGICQIPGHASAEHICKRCEGTGHSFKECPTAPRCRLCTHTGHVAEEHMCRKCGETGHLNRDCTNV